MDEAKITKILEDCRGLDAPEIKKYLIENGIDCEEFITALKESLGKKGIGIPRVSPIVDIDDENHPKIG